jgi:hypothetical protein
MSSSTDVVRYIPSVAEGEPELTQRADSGRVATDDETQTGQQTAIDGAGGDAAVPVQLSGGAGGGGGGRGRGVGGGRATGRAPTAPSSMN